MNSFCAAIAAWLDASIQVEMVFALWTQMLSDDKTDKHISDICVENILSESR